MSISGAGPVNGHVIDLSSYRGELQSQTAMALIIKSLLQAHNATDIPITLLRDNKGIQKKCKNTHTDRLHNHHESNIDLVLEYKTAAKTPSNQK
jgi:hypothetical protein